MKTQQRNRSDNRLVTFAGVTRTLTEWAELKGMLVGTLWARLGSGWSHGEAINTPVRRCVR